MGRTWDPVTNPRPLGPATYRTSHPLGMGFMDNVPVQLSGSFMTYFWTTVVTSIQNTLKHLTHCPTRTYGRNSPLSPNGVFSPTSLLLVHP